MLNRNGSIVTVNPMVCIQRLAKLNQKFWFRSNFYPKMIIGMVAMALLVVLAKFTGYFQYKYMKVQSALENTMAKKSSTKSVKFSGNEIFENFFFQSRMIRTGSYSRFRDSNVEGPTADRSSGWGDLMYEGFENLVQEGGMKIITDPDDDVFIDENKSLIK